MGSVLPCAARLESSFFLGCFSGLLEVLGRRRCLGADLVHLFLGASFDALLLGVGRVQVSFVAPKIKITHVHRFCV